MPDSILEEIREMIGQNAEDTAFDTDLRVFINSAFSTLHQIGIGPEEGFRIQNATAEWTDFLEEGPMLDMVKEYVFMKTKYAFDPPGTGFHTTAMAEIIKEKEVRLSYAREEESWVAPVRESPFSEDVFGEPIVLDGG